MYVIYLSTEPEWSYKNDYGYWAGKNYTVGGELYPVVDSCVKNRTKVYKNKKQAESMAEKLYNKMGYVVYYKVENYEDTYKELDS